MNRRNILQIALKMIFVVIFNISFFIISGIHHPVSVWIAYGFIHFSYVTFLFAPKLLGEKSKLSELGLSNDTISLTYFFIVFIEGLFFIILKMKTYKLCLLVNLFITSIYFIILIINVLANEHTITQNRTYEKELNYIREGSSKLSALLDMGLDKDIYKQVEYLYDLIHSSPAKSDISVYDYEQKVLELINTLSMNILAGNMKDINENLLNIKINANERNRILKTMR